MDEEDKDFNRKSGFFTQIFNFSWGGPRIIGSDCDGGIRHLGQQIDFQPEKTDKSEQDDSQCKHGNGHMTSDREINDFHRESFKLVCLIHKPQSALSTQRRCYSFYKDINFNYFYKIT